MRNWRPLTWVILVVQALFIWWIVGGVGGAASETMENCSALTESAKSSCEAGNAGAAIAAGSPPS